MTTSEIEKMIQDWDWCGAIPYYPSDPSKSGKVDYFGEIVSVYDCACMKLDASIDIMKANLPFNFDNAFSKYIRRGWEYDCRNLYYNRKIKWHEITNPESIIDQCLFLVMNNDKNGMTISLIKDIEPGSQIIAWGNMEILSEYISYDSVSYLNAIGNPYKLDDITFNVPNATQLKDECKWSLIRRGFHE